MAEEIISEIEMRTRGQLTIPANVRSLLNLKEGQKFILIVNDNKIILIPKSNNPMEKFGLLGNEDEDFNFKEKLLYYKGG